MAAQALGELLIVRYCRYFSTTDLADGGAVQSLGWRIAELFVGEPDNERVRTLLTHATCRAGAPALIRFRADAGIDADRLADRCDDFEIALLITQPTSRMWGAGERS